LCPCLSTVVVLRVCVGGGVSHNIGISSRHGCTLSLLRTPLRHSGSITLIGNGLIGRCSERSRIIPWSGRWLRISKRAAWLGLRLQRVRVRRTRRLHLGCRRLDAPAAHIFRLSWLRYCRRELDGMRRWHDIIFWNRWSVAREL
jgi:hypothetical protein